MLQPHWLVLPLKIFLVDRKPRDPDVDIELRVDGESISIRVAGGQIGVRLGAAERADVVVSGNAEKVLQLFAGRLSLSAAKPAGIQWDGAVEVLERVIPRL